MSFQLNKILLISFLILNVGVAYSYDNAVLYGRATTDNAGNLKTNDSDSYIIKSKKGNELRMKHLTSVNVTTNLDSFIFKEGVVGIKNASENVILSTENIKVNIFPSSVVVIKRIDNFDRVCVIKGKVNVKHKMSNSNIEVFPDYEIAASEEYLSKIYKRSDDLRYMWYWYSPEKEPSLLK